MNTYLVKEVKGKDLKVGDVIWFTGKWLTIDEAWVLKRNNPSDRNQLYIIKVILKTKFVLC